MKYALTFFFGFFLFSCAPGDKKVGQEEKESASGFEAKAETKDLSMSASEYVNWFRAGENGMRKKKTIGEVVYTLQFKSPQYVALIETGKDSVTALKINKRSLELNGLLYFDLILSLKDGTGELLKQNLNSNDEYQQRVKYMAFDMQKDVKMVQGKDTIPCGLYHFERIYDVGPYSNILLAFDSKLIDSSREMTFVLNDKIFHNGTVKFTYSANKLAYLPKLKITDGI